MADRYSGAVAHVVGRYGGLSADSSAEAGATASYDGRVTRHARRMKLGTVVVLVVAAAVLTACGPTPAGMVGVAVDAGGRPIGVLEICDAHIDGASLYETPVDDSDQSDPRHVGDWMITPAVTTSSRLDLTAPTGAWQTETPLATLQPGTSYTLYGWTRDNTWSAAAVEFSLEDLEQLRPGLVRYDAALHADDENPTDTTSTVPASEFRSIACS